ncbi:MAG TPA: hypothetical protein VNN72_20770 [Polyangiaceae bacterium]|nr:hypothetical protein [Polyangiaceae bacterium]
MGSRGAFALGAFAALLVVIAWSPAARAAGPVGANGQPITTSDYALDLYQGPLFAGTRVTGLGGAYVAISEDVDGDLQNPASPGVRPFFSYTYFDYWLGFGLTFPATLQNVDFFNSGSKTHITNSPDSFVFFTPSVNLQFGDLGVGLSLETQQYALSTQAPGDSTGRSVRVTIPTTHLQFAYGFDHNQWVAGVGARFVSMSVNGPDRQRAAFKSTGSGLEFGVVWKPEGKPLRLGFAYRTPIRTAALYKEGLLPNQEGDVVLSGSGGTYYLPKAVAFPWDVNFGFAVQFGARPMNPPWRTNDELIERQTLQYRLRQLDREEEQKQALAYARTEAERQKIERKFARQQEVEDLKLERELTAAKWQIEKNLTKMNRFYVQVASSMLVSGPVEDAVGVESLMTQVVNRSGQKTVMSPRLGIESGVIPEYLKLRAGTYIEPTRFEGSTARTHATAGLDVKLAVWNVFGLWPDNYMWRLGLGADVAHRYSTWGVTIAGWYPRHTETDKLPPEGGFEEPSKRFAQTEMER